MKRRSHISTSSTSESGKKKLCRGDSDASTSSNATTSKNSEDSSKFNQAQPYILMKNEGGKKIRSSKLYLEDVHIDRIFKALIQFRGRRHRVGFMTVLYSTLVMKYESGDDVLNTLQYIHPVFEEVSILLVPIHYKSHYTLVVFDLGKKKVWYFDSLFGGPKTSYKKIKAALERDLNCQFIEISRRECQKLINYQIDGYNCGVHICRIAEEIIFYGVSRCLFPFDIDAERRRIREIYNGICDPSWNGQEWFPQLQIEPEAVESGSLTLAHAKDADFNDLSSGDGDDTTTTDIADRTCSESPDSVIFVDDEQVAVISHDYLAYLIETLPQITVNIHSVIPSFAQLSVLRTCYQYLERFRKKEYNRSRQSLKLCQSFSFDLFEKLNKNELIFVNHLVNGFQAYFDLSAAEKVLLFENFYPTFIIFERAYDTVNFMKEKCEGKSILLQNGTYFNVEDVEFAKPDGEMDDETFGGLTKFHWITVGFEKLLAIMVELGLYPIEVVYGFGLILLDVEGIESPLSQAVIQAKQNLFQRINADLFQFYNENEERLSQRIAEIDEAIKAAKELAANYMNAFKKLQNCICNNNNGFFIESSTTSISNADGNNTATTTK